MQFLSESADGGSFEGVLVPALDPGVQGVLLPALLRNPCATSLLAEVAGLASEISVPGSLQIAVPSNSPAARARRA